VLSHFNTGPLLQRLLCAINATVVTARLYLG
jgi:hypothetical protein